jgi:hypothetical protein
VQAIADQPMIKLSRGCLPTTLRSFGTVPH